MIISIRHARRVVLPVVIAALSSFGSTGLAQQPASGSRRLSLAEALRLAEARSDAVGAARAARGRADGEGVRASSSLWPRIAAYSAYDRSLRSEFEDLAVFGTESTSESEDAPDIPFGSANTYRVGLTASYTVFAGGRSMAERRAAASGRRSAEIGVESARAAVLLEATEAYYDAVLGAHLERIAEWTYAQADSTYRRAMLATQVGRGSEFDLVRAKVTRDRQRPVVIRQRANREIADLRLLRLLHLSGDEPLALTSDLDIDPSTPTVRLASHASGPSASAPPRAAVRVAAEAVRRSEQTLRAERAGRHPELALTSTYERVAYPPEGTPAWNDFRTNWTVGARLDVPLFTGGQRRGGEMVARAELEGARANLREVERLAALDASEAEARLAAAQAAWEANEGGLLEAFRAFEIASLRYREGLSTQLELADSRILLEQSRAERARAARDVLVERVRASLLADLPLGGRSSTPLSQPVISGSPQSVPHLSTRSITYGARTP